MSSLDDIASFDGRIAKVQGPARSGKTEALARRAAHLISDGADPASILVETTSGFAAQAFRRRLTALAGERHAQKAACVAVRTPLGICAHVLDTPAARAATDRVPRVLTAAEYGFLVEDMKTLGMPLRKLRRMLEHLYQQMEDLQPRSEWCVTGEEQAVLDHLVRTLVSRGAMVRHEAPALAADFLKSEVGATARASYDYVLCDDFQNLSRAQQTCLCLLAGAQLIVAGNPNQTITAASDHPNPRGFSQFDTVRRNVRTFILEGAFARPAITAFIDALCDQGDMDPMFKANHAHMPTRENELEAVKWNSPEDELNGLTAYLRSLSSTDGNPKESRTCVLVPDKRWAALVARLLRTRGFEVSTAGALTAIGGDPRDSARARALVAYTKLSLLANPHDLTAWRSWCGFDNHLTNSDAWANLAALADAQGVSLYEALAQMAAAAEGDAANGHADDTASRTVSAGNASGAGASTYATCAAPASDGARNEPFPRASILTQRWREGQDFIAKNAARRGFALMRAIGATDLPEFEDVSAALVGDEDAAALHRLARASVTEPTWPESERVLHVATYDALCGTEYDRVFALATVDGLIPCRDAFEVVSTKDARERTMNRERKRFANAVSKARDHLAISFFSKASLELAERSKMQVTRVRSENGERIAVVRPSSLLAEAGNAAPATTGGQSLLSERGLN
ncbi:hypothetical protein B5F40_10380 [Gordonibacter sp. An230]|nr:hypothetical protein B5F40_10380 [Gordonibacter sp. An230]